MKAAPRYRSLPARPLPLGIDLVTISTDAAPGGNALTSDPRVLLLLGAAIGAGVVSLIFTWK